MFNQIFLKRYERVYTKWTDRKIRNLTGSEDSGGIGLNFYSQKLNMTKFHWRDMWDAYRNEERIDFYGDIVRLRFDGYDGSGYKGFPSIGFYVPIRVGGKLVDCPLRVGDNIGLKDREDFRYGDIADL